MRHQPEVTALLESARSERRHPNSPEPVTSLELPEPNGASSARLTPMQAALQNYLRAHSGATLSRQQLCQEVWRMNYYNSRTVDQTISVVRKHLAEDETIVTVFGIGYRHERARQPGRQSSKRMALHQHVQT